LNIQLISGSAQKRLAVFKYITNGQLPKRRQNRIVQRLANAPFVAIR
jgi:hypothetical protein